MRYLFFWIFSGIAAVGFAQHEKHGNSTPWEVFAGYIQPLGRFSDEVDFNNDNSYGAPVYYASFASQTGMHARSGANVGLCYNLTFLKRSGGRNSGEVRLYPLIMNVIFYDLQSNGPAMTSSAIKPILQYEAAVDPSYTLSSGGRSSISFLVHVGLAVKKASGEVHFEPSAFGPPAADAPTNIHIDYATYAYTGAGLSIGPGIKFTTGRFGIGAVFHSEFMTGTYKGQAFYKTTSGNESPYSPDLNIPNTVMRTSFINFTLSYAFGFSR